MPHPRTALVTGANQGIGKAVAAQLVADGLRVYLGSRDLARGRAASDEIGEGAVALRLDVTDRASVDAAALRIGEETGSLDVLVNNAGTATSRTDVTTLADLRAASGASQVSLDDVRAVWEVNVFGALSVYQAVLPLLRRSPTARVVNVTSALGSLALASDPAGPVRASYEAVYAASKTALDAVTLAMVVEQEGLGDEGVRIHLVSPGFARTALVNYEGTESVEDAAREVVRVARLGPDAPGGTFTTWEGVPLPW